METIKSEDILEAGTGFMQSLSEALRQLVTMGYTENLVARGDHFECGSGKYKIYPKDIIVDKMLRFENTSDPDDQSILYAISAPDMRLKGVYVDAYGIYQEDLSRPLMEVLTHHLHLH